MQPKDTDQRCGRAVKEREMPGFRPLIFVSTAVSLFAVAAPTFAQDVAFPMRDGARPETTSGVPHVQIGIQPVPELSEEMLRQVADFPGVVLGATRVSLPGAVGFQLTSDVSIAQPQAIVGGREFAHLHPDGSLHASLHPDTARAAVEAGWAVAHPWADRRSGWEGFVMIYTPLNAAELDTVLRLVRSSYSFVTGRSLPDL